MGIDTDIWKALRDRAEGIPLSPKLPIAWPNDAFTKPTGQWLRVSWIPNRNRRLLIGSKGPHQKQGLLQIDFFAPLNSGTNTALAGAEKVAAHFPCDARLVNGSTCVRITKAPDIGPALPGDTHWQVPVTIDYETFG